MAADTPDGDWKRVLGESVRRKLDAGATLGRSEEERPASAQDTAAWSDGPGAGSLTAWPPQILPEQAPSRASANEAAGWPAESDAAGPVNRTLLWSGEAFAASGETGPGAAAPGGARSAELVVDDLRAHLLTPQEEKRALAILSGRRPPGSVGTFVASAAVAVVAASAGVFVLGRGLGGEGALRLAGELAPPPEQPELAGLGPAGKVHREEVGRARAAPAGSRTAGGPSGSALETSGGRAKEAADGPVFRAVMRRRGAPDRLELGGPLVDLDLRPPTRAGPVDKLRPAAPALAGEPASGGQASTFTRRRRALPAAAGAQDGGPEPIKALPAGRQGAAAPAAAGEMSKRARKAAPGQDPGE